MNDPLTQRLRLLDTAAVSDALDRLGLTGVACGLSLLAGGDAQGTGRVAGRAVTVKVGVATPGVATPGPLCTAAIDQAGPDQVIVVEERSGLDAACWGGLLTLGATLRGIAGAIIDGAIRDLDEARDYHFPIHARRLTARSSRGRLVEVGTQVPVRIGTEGLGAVTVFPGDYVLADGSAVVFIPAEHVHGVIAAAEAIVAREADLLRAILAGGSMRQTLAGYQQLVRSD